jgi:hypothetical protein
MTSLKKRSYSTILNRVFSKNIFKEVYLGIKKERNQGVSCCCFTFFLSDHTATIIQMHFETCKKQNKKELLASH